MAYIEEGDKKPPTGKGSSPFQTTPGFTRAFLGKREGIVRSIKAAQQAPPVPDELPFWKTPGFTKAYLGKHAGIVRNIREGQKSAGIQQIPKENDKPAVSMETVRNNIEKEVRSKLRFLPSTFGRGVPLPQSKPIAGTIPIPAGTSEKDVNNIVNLEVAKGIQMYRAKYGDSPTEMVTTKTDAEILAKLEDDVRKSITYVPPGASKEDVKKFIDEQVKAKSVEFIQPKQIYLPDGTPVYTSKENERDAFLYNIRNKKGVEKFWLKNWYDFSHNAGRAFETLFGGPSYWAKEMITDKDEPNVLGAIAETGLNAVMLAGEYIRSFPAAYSVDEMEKRRASLLSNAAQARSEGQLDMADAMEGTAQELKERIEIGRAAELRIAGAKQALSNAWNELVTGVKEQQEYRKEGVPIGGVAALATGSQYMQDLLEEREAAKLAAVDYRTQAQAAYANGQFQQALGLIRLAQEADRKSVAGDPYGAYTWIRDEEAHEKFLEAVAVVELQSGQPLSTQVIRDIKLHYANSWTEITGEVIIDPLNLIPVSMLEDAIKIPYRMSKVGLTKAAGAFPEAAKVITAMGSPVRWMKRPAVRSAANQVTRTFHNLVFNRIAQAYDNTPDLVSALGSMGKIADEIKLARTSEDAKRLFDLRKTEVRGLANITYDDFRQLMAAGDHIPMQKWGTMYENLLRNSEAGLTQGAIARGIDPKTIVDEVGIARAAQYDMSHKFYEAFIEPHRILKGSVITDDSIGGWIVKTLRGLSGAEVNDVLKLSGFDQAVREVGQTFGPTSKEVLKVTSGIMEALMHGGVLVKDVWASVVLTTSRWLITNIVDTGGRQLIYGSNPFDSLKTLFLSTQRHFADELGIVPIEFSQSLARSGVDIPENVVTSLLYENFDPKFGILSYAQREYKRLVNTEASKKTADIIDRMLGGLPSSKLKDAMTWMADGFSVKLPSVLKSLPGAVADYNTVIEFTFRLRTFHKKYFELLKVLEPQYFDNASKGLSPATREVAKQIWRLSEGNPSKVVGLVDSITSKAPKGVPARWSFLVPPKIDDTLKNMNPELQRAFITEVRSGLESMVEKAAKTGKSPSRAELKAYMNDFKNRMTDEVQAQISAASDMRKMDTTIGKGGKPAPAPNPNDLKGSFPRERKVSPRVEDTPKPVQDAMSQLTRSRFKAQSVEDVATNFETAIKDYAAIRKIDGDIVRFIPEENVIEVGQGIKSRGELYTKLSDAVLNVIKNTDSDFTLRSFDSLDDYATTIQRFMQPNGAAEVLAESESKFIAVVDQLSTHPQLKTLLEKTSGKKVDYDALMEVYHNFGVYDNAYGFIKEPKVIMDEVTNLKMNLPVHYRAAVQEHRAATVGLARMRQGLDTVVGDTARDKIGLFLESWDAHRTGLKEFYRHIEPGPLMFARGSDARSAAWRKFFNEIAPEQYIREAKIKNTLIELFKTDPAAAEKYLDDVLADFPTTFLKDNGIQVSWDADRQIITDFKMTIGGRTQSFNDPTTRAVVDQYFFGVDVEGKMRNNPLLRIGKDGQLTAQRQLTNNIREVFGLTDEQSESWARVMMSHAKRWSQETGRNADEYLARLGFQKLDNSYGLASQTDFRLVKRGAVQRGKDGQFVFYGLNQSNFESLVQETSELFFNDLVEMSSHNPKILDDLNTIKAYLKKETGLDVVANKLSAKHSEAFAKVFTEYTAEGIGPDIALKRPFQNFKRWLSDTFENTKDTSLSAEMSDEVYESLNRMFVETKMEVTPRSNTRAIKLMAKEVGLPTTEDELLKVINEAVAPPPVELSTTIPANSIPIGKFEQDLPGSSIHFRGQAIAPDDPMIPETVYHVTTNRSAVEASGKLKASGVGGLGGDPTDKIVSLTITKDVAIQLEKDLRLAAQAQQMPVEQVGKFLDDASQAEGWKFGSEMFKDSGYGAGDYLRQYFVARESRMKIRNPILFNSEALKEVDIANIGIIEIPKSNLAASGSLITNFDVGKYSVPYIGLDEIRVYGDVPLEMAQTSRAYSDLADVPKDVAERAFSQTDTPYKAKVTAEINEAWDSWKTQRALKGFSDDELATIDTFKKSLKERMDGVWEEGHWHYNRLMAETEAFENALMSHHFGTEFETHFMPRIPEAEMNDGMKTFIRNAEENMSNYEIATRALDDWGNYLGDLADGKNPFQDLTASQFNELNNWKANASKSKAEMMDVILNGGKSINGNEFEGAVDFVNRIMLDYQHYSVFDQFMKNFFPFWMFPSRSFPFWIETLATHPQVIAGYEKTQRMSQSQRYQAGAVTSKGKPLPSLDGYIKIPGTDLWFNPLAPFSFHYVLDISKAQDDLMYQVQSQDQDIDPKTAVAREIMDMSQVFGFAVAPWMAFAMKKAFDLPDTIVPQFPIAPEIPLIPRWMVADEINKLNKITTFGTPLGDMIYPEVSWHDFLVEKRIYEDALQKIQGGRLTPEQQDDLRVQMTEAVKNKDNALWDATYKQVTNEEAARAAGSFFTGIYAKPFTDSSADLIKLKNDIRLMQSALNNQFQAELFNLPEDPHQNWNKYMEKLDSDEGWIYRLYSDSGWVRNDDGMLINDPKERAMLLAKQIEMDERQSIYYDEMKKLQDKLNSRLRTLPIGASWEMTKPIYDWYNKEREKWQDYKSPKVSHFTNKPKELISEDLRNDWFRTLKEFAPRYEPHKGETYDEYEQRLENWYGNLDKFAPVLMAQFHGQKDVVQLLGALRPDQKLDEGLFNSLVRESSKEGIQNWESQTDDLFDALNNAYRDLYWSPYWKSGILEGGFRGRANEAEFLATHPMPPSTQEMFAYIQERYGDRFTLEEIAKWTEDSGSMTPEEKKLEGKPEDYSTRTDIWDMLSWVGPGGRNRTLLDEAFKNAGGDPDWMTVWYEEETAGAGAAFNTQPEKLQQFHDALREAMRSLNLKPPSRSELVVYAQAEQENKDFQKLIQRELGEEFPAMLSFYNSLSLKEKKNFRNEQSALYETIQTYYGFKEEYAEDHPVWKDYYGFDLTPSIQAPEYKPATFTGDTFTPPKSIKPERQYDLIPSQKELAASVASPKGIPYFGISSRNGDFPDMSPDFLKTVGETFTWEISQLYSNNRKLSRSATQFLMNLSGRHPEWRDTVDNILSKNRG